MNVVIVGYGMAGARLAADLRARCADVKVTAFAAEAHRAYNRILLSSVLAGKAQEEDLALAEPSGAVDVRFGVPVTGLDPAQRVVSTVDGDFDYDVAVLATGSQPILPPVEGLVSGDGVLPEGVSLFRTLDDCRRIVGSAVGARTAIVLGGGLLGLEAARGLAGRGLDVTVVHAAGHLMERQLDREAGGVLASTLARLGVRTQVAALATRRITGGLLLADGTELTADLLVVACGVRADTALAHRASLAVNRGILVDDAMRTSDERIYAIGDCAEHRGTVYGLVAPAWEQASTVADRLTGGTARYVGSRPVTRLKVSGIDLAAMGTLDDEADAEVLRFADPSRGTYAKLVIRDDRLTGAVLVGDNPTVGTVVQLFDRGSPVPADRRTLLLGRAIGGQTVAADSPALMPDAALVCRCNTVTKAAITTCWRRGARSPADVAAQSHAGTGCGSCSDAVAGLLDWLSTVDPTDDTAEVDPISAGVDPVAEVA
jgi:assimilatory nitrate reductase electron transfer subunit